MIKKYISKFTIDILPSIIATIVGAYIVTHYINPKSDTGRPAPAVASTPDSAIDSKAAVASPADKSPDAAVATPKARVEKASIEKPEKDTGTSDPRRHQPGAREKAAKAAPAAATPTPEERRDANDLARAAIERLRGSRDAQPAAQEAAKPTELAHVQEAARSVPAPVQQLPPPINVATPVDTYGSAPARPPYPAERAAEQRGPVPPGDIPTPPPLDLQADSGRVKRADRTNVAEDVLSAAKSVFHSVIPQPFDQ